MRSKEQKSYIRYVWFRIQVLIGSSLGLSELPIQNYVLFVRCVCVEWWYCWPQLSGTVHSVSKWQSWCVQ